MSAYYNEIDMFAAEWLRNLIKAGHIADGEVDTRSIADVSPDDLRGFDQCHFFAGIGGWSHALRLAGWPDDRPIWTGSCPCQPFSVAGKGKGKDDERHLWPVFHQLIAECRPPVVMGEQVAGKAGYGWFDGVQSDLEREGYASRAVDIPACAVNAPHIRQRLYWVAYAESIGWRQGAKNIGGLQSGDSEERPVIRLAIDSDVFGGDMGHAACSGQLGQRRTEEAALQGECSIRSGEHQKPGIDGELSRGTEGFRGASLSSAVGDADALRELQPQGIVGQQRGWSGNASGGDMENPSNDGTGCIIGAASDSGWRTMDAGTESIRQTDRPCCTGRTDARDTGNHWHDHEWLTGADGKTRRAKPGVRLLANGVPNRVGRLRGYGNAIVPPLAAEVIKAFMET
jgi:DNA (cytosine-5)-methyltransferase 1